MLSSAFLLSPSFLQNVWKSSLGRMVERARIKTQMTGLKRTESVMCVPWFLLLELSGVPVCDSPQEAFGKGKKPK